MLKGSNNPKIHKSIIGTVVVHPFLIGEVLGSFLFCLNLFLLFSFYLEKPVVVVRQTRLISDSEVFCSILFCFIFFAIFILFRETQIKRSFYLEKLE